MSEVTNFSGGDDYFQPQGHQPAERDLSRPHWQRSVGYVLMNELADQFFDREPYPIEEVDIDAINDWAYAHLQAYGDITWARAAATASIFPRILYKEQPIHVRQSELEQVNQQIDHYTFFETVHAAYEEGMDTMFTFPIKLVKEISDEARRADEPERVATNLLEIAGLLRQDDIQVMVHQAAFTKNDVWGGSATGQSGKITDNRSFPQPVLSVQNGLAAFTPAMIEYLVGGLREVNRQGRSRAQASLPERPSSGCPIRHERAHFGDSAEDMKNLAMLGKFFYKNIDELLRPRDGTAITRGLNYTADLLERVHPLYADT